MQDFNFQRGGGDHYKMLRTPSLVGALNAWCAEWGSRIFSELYLRTKCGQTGRPAADLSLHPSDIPDACMLLHSAVIRHRQNHAAGCLKLLILAKAVQVLWPTV